MHIIQYYADCVQSTPLNKRKDFEPVFMLLYISTVSVSFPHFTSVGEACDPLGEMTPRSLKFSQTYKQEKIVHIPI